ncbi:DinB family protein [Polaribacter sp. MSW13]|uniref:DinB family protein n=1 Tax=Polaribacter marinus TaxID=2916838 RepID=A0A9X1VLL4_9FLAO|nr:DinB family protein [Polaribacter marinus]MCI2228739.1 DinB family protein [Polaribacter marinus]
MKTLNTISLENKLNLLENYIPSSDRINTAISKANVAWHIDHSLKVMNAVVKNMQNSDPTLYVDNFSFLGKLLLQFNFFPRGRAKAPKDVKPPEIILKEDIITQLAEARQNIKEILKLDEKAYFKHPLFGNVNKARVVRFLNAHTNHHLKIIKSILK